MPQAMWPTYKWYKEHRAKERPEQARDIDTLFTTVGDEYLAYDLAHSTPNNSNVPDDILSGHRCKERADPSSTLLSMAVALLDCWFRIEIEA
jgi:hypothetical protein